MQVSDALRTSAHPTKCKLLFGYMKDANKQRKKALQVRAFLRLFAEGFLP